MDTLVGDICLDHAVQPFLYVGGINVLVNPHCLCRVIGAENHSFKCKTPWTSPEKGSGESSLVEWHKELNF